MNLSVQETALSGCSCGKQAAAGEVLFTMADDHLSCLIGADTRGVELPATEAEGQQQMIGMMVALQYIRMDEVPGIRYRNEPFGVVVYSPMDS